MNENKMFNQLTAITRFACNYYNQGYCQPSKQTCFAACPRCTLHDRSQRCNHLLYQQARLGDDALPYIRYLNDVVWPSETNATNEQDHLPSWIATYELPF